MLKRITNVCNAGYPLIKPSRFLHRVSTDSGGFLKIDKKPYKIHKKLGGTASGRGDPPCLSPLVGRTLPRADIVILIQVPITQNLIKITLQIINVPPLFVLDVDSPTEMK